MGFVGIIVAGFICGAILTALVVEITSKPVAKDVEKAHLDHIIKTMVAYRSGAKIEFMILDGSDGCIYRDCPMPAWNWGIADYRVKEGK